MATAANKQSSEATEARLLHHRIVIVDGGVLGRLMHGAARLANRDARRRDRGAR